jgi:hypothetical protein
MAFREKFALFFLVLVCGFVMILVIFLIPLWACPPNPLNLKKYDFDAVPAGMTVIYGLVYDNAVVQKAFPGVFAQGVLEEPGYLGTKYVGVFFGVFLFF